MHHPPGTQVVREPKIPSDRCPVSAALPTQQWPFFKPRVGEKVKPEFSRPGRALERHCVALQAERRGRGRFKFGGAPSWIRCSFSRRLRYITRAENGHAVTPVASGNRGDGSGPDESMSNCKGTGGEYSMLAISKDHV